MPLLDWIGFVILFVVVLGVVRYARELKRKRMVVLQVLTYSGCWYTSLQLRPLVGNSVYMILAALEEEGLVRSRIEKASEMPPETAAARLGRPRKLYRATNKGRDVAVRTPWADVSSPPSEASRIVVRKRQFDRWDE